MTDKNKEPNLEDLREIHIKISFGGLVKAYKKMFFEAPFHLYQRGTLKVENISKKMMTGKGSLLGLPMGIILRNTSRSMYLCSKGDGWYNLAHGVAGAITAVSAVGAGIYFGAPLMAAYGLGAVASYVPVVAASALILPIPAFTAGSLMTSTLAGAAVALFSTLVAAPVNLLVGYKRTIAAFKGVKLTEEQMEGLRNEFDKDSIQKSYDREYINTVGKALWNMSPTAKAEVYMSLKQEFDAAAAAAQAAQPAAAATSPAVKRKTP